MEIPFFGLDRQYSRYKEDFLSITDRVLSSGKVLQGADVVELENKLSSRCNRKGAVAVGSCTDALAFALLAAGVKAGDEVLVTSFSFFASVSPILRVGALPRFIDIEAATYMMDISLLERQITAKTKALLAVHLFGQTLPMADIEDFCRRHGLILIEDAAQALGASDEDRQAGSMGVVSCLSFDPTKVIGSFGSAGVLLSDDEDILDHARALRYHGRNPKTRQYEILGFNSQLASEMAGMLSFKVDQLDEWIGERDEIARIYLEGLKDVPDIILPQKRQGSTHNWHKFVIRSSKRDELEAYLASKGIATMVHYPRPLCDEPLVQGYNLPADAIDVPCTRHITSQVLSLPIFPELTPQEAGYVVECVRGFFICTASQ